MAMWLEAIDLVLSRIAETGLDLSQVRGLSGSGQQHGSVWWNREAEVKLGSLKKERTLLEQLQGALSSPNAPNWQDHTTQAECDEFHKLFGSKGELANITGSSAHHVRKLFLIPKRGTGAGLLIGDMVAEIHRTTDHAHSQAAPGGV